MYDFQPTDEQRAIETMARQFAADTLAPNAVAWDQEKHFPVDALRKAAELGMAGIFVREAHGGTALGRLDGTILFEALAHGCPTVAAFLSIHNMCAWMIDAFGSEALRTRHLPDLCAMRRIASYCLTEPGAGSDASALATRAVRDGDHFIVDGTKSFISGGGVSDLYLVMVRTGASGAGGISTLLIEKGAKGLSFGANERKMGWNAQPTAQVIMEGCRVPASNLLGREGDGFRYAMQGLDGGRLNIAACSLGAAQEALDRTLAYTHERQAFGKSLDSFQALQFRLADMATELAAARVFLRQAAWSLDRGEANAATQCAMAKRFVTDVAFNVANEALQLHGGYGYLADFGLEKIVRDLRVHQILEGTNEIMRVIIARALLARDRG
jgi:alkylation response protein AidB-like acyl-CoA dehydrogenase